MSGQSPDGILTDTVNARAKPRRGNGVRYRFQVNQDLATARSAAESGLACPSLPPDLREACEATLRELPAAEALVRNEPGRAYSWFRRWLKSTGRRLAAALNDDTDAGPAGRRA